MKTLILTALLILGALAMTPTAQAADTGIPWPGGQTPDVQCMDVYSQTYLFGGYWLVRRDSCSAQLYECPAGYSPPAPPCHEAELFATSASSSSPLACYMVYSRTDVGTYSVVRRTSCSPPEVYQCPYEGAPIDRCTSIANTLLRASALSGPSLPPLECYDIYSRHEVGPVAVVMTSSCSGHVEVCDDPVAIDRALDLSCVTDAVQLTSAASAQPMCMYYYYELEAGPVRHVQRDSCHSENYVCDLEAVAFAEQQLSSTDPVGMVDCASDGLGVLA